MPAFEPPGECPNCGEWVPAEAPACAHCGADPRTAWSDDTALDGVDLPGEGHDYDRIVEREWGAGRPRGVRAWLTLGLVALLVLVLGGLGWWLR